MAGSCAKVVTLGYISVDHTIVLPYYPEAGEKLGMLRYDRFGGGQAATAAAALARWGCRTRCIGRVGGDDTGDEAIRLLREAGVLTDAVIPTPGATSQFAFIMLDIRNGERTVLWNRDPGLNLKPADVRLDWLETTHVLLIDGHELDAALKAARYVRERGGRVVLDAEKLGEGRDELLSSVDVCVASAYFGRRTFGIDEPSEVVRRIRSYGIPVAGVTLGAEGSVADWGEGLRRVQPLTVKAVDTTGAGDVYHAALAYSLLEKMAPGEMFRFASAAAGLSCLGMGGRSALPELGDISACMPEIHLERLE